jgi:Fe-S cluster assembly iron-binding protein IscA
VLPFKLTDTAKERIDEIGKATMTFRVWGVNPPGYLAIEVFLEDMRSHEIDYKEFRDENVIAHIPTKHYEYIKGVTVDFSEWNNEYESNYNPNKTFNHRGFECLPHQVETSEIRLSWFEVNEVIKKIFSMNYDMPYSLHRQAASNNYLRIEKDKEEEELEESLFSFEEIERAVKAGFY